MAWRGGGKLASQAVHDAGGIDGDIFGLSSSVSEGAVVGVSDGTDMVVNEEDVSTVFAGMSALFPGIAGRTWPGKKAQPIGADSAADDDDLSERLGSLAVRSPRRPDPALRSDTQSPQEFSTPGKWPRVRSSAAADTIPFLPDINGADAVPQSPASVPWTAQPIGAGGFAVLPAPELSLPVLSPPPSMDMLSSAFPPEAYLGGSALDDIFFVPTRWECEMLKRCLELVNSKTVVNEDDRQLGTGVRAMANMISRSLCAVGQLCINRTWPKDDPNGKIIFYMSLADSEPKPGMMRVRWKWVAQTSERGRGETFSKQVARIAEMYGMPSA